MTLEDLIRRFRVLADDKVAPYLFSDEDITDWLNDAQVQACVRGRLLLEDADPAMCNISVRAGVHTYPLHPLLYEIERLDFKVTGGTCSQPIKIKSRGWLDENRSGWRHDDRGVLFAIQGETSMRLVSTPNADGILTIEAYRLPRKVLANDSDKPEIHQASHEQLIHWALHRAFSIPSTETFDANRAANAEAVFTAYFGVLPDSDMRRLTREDTDHVIKVHL